MSLELVSCKLLELWSDTSKIQAEIENNRNAFPEIQSALARDPGLCEVFKTRCWRDEFKEAPLGFYRAYIYDEKGLFDLYIHLTPFGQLVFRQLVRGPDYEIRSSDTPLLNQLTVKLTPVDENGEPKAPSIVSSVEPMDHFNVVTNDGRSIPKVTFEFTPENPGIVACFKKVKTAPYRLEFSRA